MLILSSPAKLNLFFRVLHKRSDGFHEIASLFQAVDLCDTLKIERVSKEDRLVSTDPHLPTDGSNLILRAAALFRKKTGCLQHFHFFIDKKIPIEAGLGGGSSNAATTLWGLNQLTGAQVDEPTLAAWGSELGSDVPFFFSHGSAYCEGRGERLTDVSLPFAKTFWLAKPKAGLSTPAVYRATRVDTLAPRDPRKSLDLWLQGRSCFFNDLEPAAFALLPSLALFKQHLYHLGFDHVHMTGSGTGFICEGTVHAPSLPDVLFFPVTTLIRKKGEWYSKPNE